MKAITGVMFPSDLEGTILESMWAQEYKATLKCEPNNEKLLDRYMDDFWKWIDKYATKKEQYAGHDVYEFNNPKEVWRDTLLDMELYLYNMGLAPKRQYECAIRNINEMYSAIK